MTATESRELIGFNTLESSVVYSHEIEKIIATTTHRFAAQA
ncbi:hypothetical protein [Lysobacter enzymogenes]|nr:hypothetical protein [Lysobacter enzymogenes]